MRSFFALGLALAPLSAQAADPASLRQQVDASFDAQWSDLEAPGFEVGKIGVVVMLSTELTALSIEEKSGPPLVADR